ncbi:ferric reductase-like transmembrane domain-containing protein [Candidatus Woesearchaeota archaeon]|nr:ferric reductase-like transmembrane domain-containing protein [Candidatus Woesearchaeota archaeon]
MNIKTIMLIILGIMTTGSFIYLTNQIQDTYYIWLVTRVVGLISFLLLFLTVLIGEARVMTQIKANFTLFRFHVPFAIGSMFLVLLHGIAALTDNFKWGKGLSWVQYLGFSFSDKWVTLLSLGTLSFYLILIVGITSNKRMIQTMGYKTWKRVHYLSYISFILGFVHAFFLGTDFKTGPLAWLISPLYTILFLIIMSLLLARIISKTRLVEQQRDITVAAVFCIILVLGAAFLVHSVTQKREILNTALQQESIDFNVLEEQIRTIQQQNIDLASQIQDVHTQRMQS